MEHIFQVFEVIARGGGGGSGGGGGGGGSGGSGGGGGGGIFALWAWIVGQGCQWLMRLPKPYNYIASYLFAAIATVASLKLPFGGLFAFTAVVGAYMGITGKLSAVYRYAKNHKKAAKELKRAAKDDIQWDWEKLQPELSNMFYAFQKDWSEFNLSSIQKYTTPLYFNRTQLLLMSMKQLGRQNRMNEVKILNMVPAHFSDYPDDRHDKLSIVIVAKAQDELWEGEEQLYVDKSSFVEEWQFVRDPADKMWLLDNIVQRGTETPLGEVSKLLEFSNKNNFVYSGDFGWLLLPKRGQVFSKASFKNSDINSHVIGVYRNVLVQFYSYLPSKNQTSSLSYVIAQATVPKQYGNIVVRRKTWWRFWTPGKLTRVVPEWGDFNKKYDVFASDIEKVTSLELLHPAFMVKLEALPFKTNIEVVDNNVYFYTEDKKADYQKLLGLLHEAFDEMKL